MAVRNPSSKNSALKQTPKTPTTTASKTSEVIFTQEQLEAIGHPEIYSAWPRKKQDLFREQLRRDVTRGEREIKRLKAKIKYQERKLAAGSLKTRAKAK